MMQEASRLRNGWIKKLAQGLSATVVLALVALLAGAATSQTAATGSGAAVIQTDKAEYLAGEVVTISGSGFAELERVMLQVKHAGGTTETGAGHEAWFVNAGTDGSFTSTWSISPDDDAGVNLVLTAAGSSGAAAQAEFARVAAISASPFSSLPGGAVQVRASGFNPNQRVTIQVNDQDALTAQSDQSGHVTASLNMRQSSSAKSYSL